MFHEIPKKEFNENLIRAIADEWMLITAGDETSYNMMTASWGFAGEIWGEDAVGVVIRPQRYTKEFVDGSDYFSLTFFGDKKDIHKICGSMSGRDVDKTALTGLTPVFDEAAPYFEQARLVIICKKQYVQRLESECFTDKAPLEKWYNDDLHYLYIGKIEKILYSE